MADEPDLTAELDAVETVTEWGTRQPSGYVRCLGSDDEAEKICPHAGC